MSIKIIDHSTYLLQITPYFYIEEAARNCYQSEVGSSDEETIEFIKRLIRKGHEAMLEFCDLTFHLITDRGIMGELTRHRIGCSYAIESSRYCNYGGEDITFIRPISLLITPSNNEKEFTPYQIWVNTVKYAAIGYQELIQKGYSPQIARSVLPMSLKTSIIVKFNMRSFRHFLKLRLDKAAHPDMRYVAGLMARAVAKTKANFMIEDILEKYKDE